MTDSNAVAGLVKIILELIVSPRRKCLEKQMEIGQKNTENNLKILPLIKSQFVYQNN